MEETEWKETKEGTDRKNRIEKEKEKKTSVWGVPTQVIWTDVLQARRRLSDP